MHIGFLNPQGNFDPADSHLTAHPDFGGQLVYVKQLGLALAQRGHQIDILTRRIIDPDWPEYGEALDAYPGVEGVRIVRLAAGPDDRFLPKEELWPYLAGWVDDILGFYPGGLPEAFTAHYGDGGLAAVLLRDRTGAPFTFTAHSLGASKLDSLGASAANLADLDGRFRFGRRLVAERLAMDHAGVIVTSTREERYAQYGHPAYAEAVDVDDDDRFALVPPGVDTAVFGPDPHSPAEDLDVAHVLDRLARDLPEERVALPAVVASSRLDPKKNHLALVQAFAASPALAERANLVLLTGSLDDPLRQDEGASPEELAVLAPIRRLLDEAGLWGKVSSFAVLSQEALAAAYRYFARVGSVFALTAHHEPFGLAPLEAAAVGMPVVVTRHGGPSESLRDEQSEYGVLVDPQDPAAIAAGLERALGPEWGALAAAGRRRVLDRYTWDRTAAGYEEAIARAQASRRTPALAIHPYFRDGRPDVSPDELAALYLG